MPSVRCDVQRTNRVALSCGAHVGIGAVGSSAWLGGRVGAQAEFSSSSCFKIRTVFRLEAQPPQSLTRVIPLLVLSLDSIKPGKPPIDEREDFRPRPVRRFSILRSNLVGEQVADKEKGARIVAVVPHATITEALCNSFRVVRRHKADYLNN